MIIATIMAMTTAATMMITAIAADRITGLVVAVITARSMRCATTVYRLRPPPRGYHWGRGDDSNFLLVAVVTGVILDVATH